MRRVTVKRTQVRHVLRAAAEAGLAVEVRRVLPVLRMQRGQPVQGAVFLLRKPAP